MFFKLSRIILGAILGILWKAQYTSRGPLTVNYSTIFMLYCNYPRSHLYAIYSKWITQNNGQSYCIGLWMALPLNSTQPVRQDQVKIKILGILLAIALLIKNIFWYKLKYINTILAK